MTRFRNRQLVIIPAAKRKAVNDALQALGWGPDNFSQPLIGTASGPTATPTHYVCDIVLTDRLKVRLAQVLQGTVSIGPNAEHKDPLALSKKLTAAGLKRKPVAAIQI